MQKSAIAVIAVIALIALAGIGARYFSISQESYFGPAEPIILGGLVSDANIMLFTAEDQHFFAQNGINFTDKYVAAVWPDHQFSLLLDQSLLIAMNDEGRWAISNNLTTEKTMPDFRDYIYTKGLEEVKSESINIR